MMMSDENPPALVVKENRGGHLAAHEALEVRAHPRFHGTSRFVISCRRAILHVTWMHAASLPLKDPAVVSMCADRARAAKCAGYLRGKGAAPAAHAAAR